MQGVQHSHCSAIDLLYVYNIVRFNQYIKKIQNHLNSYYKHIQHTLLLQQ